MKTLTKITFLTGTLIAAMICLAPAQPAPDRPEGPGDGPRPKRLQNAGDERGNPERGNQAFRGIGQNLPIMEQVLTEDQRDAMRKTMEAQREKIRTTTEKIRDARKAMLTTAFADEFKEEVVRAKAQEVAKLEAELSIMRLRAIAEVQPALSKEQIERLTNPPVILGGDRENRNQPPRLNNRRNRPGVEPREGEDGPRPPRRDDQ